MAVSVVAHYPDLDAETYDKVVASLDMDVNPPAGAILHEMGWLLLLTAAFGVLARVLVRRLGT